MAVPSEPVESAASVGDAAVGPVGEHVNVADDELGTVRAADDA